MKIKKSTLYPAIFICVIAACKKTNTGPILTPSEKILTNHNWHIKALTVSQVNDPTSDSSILKPCADSALMAFEINGNFKLADASKSGCDSLAIPYDQGTWKLSSNNDTLFLNGKRNFTWKLNKITDTVINASFRDSLSPIANQLKKITLKP